MLSQQFALLMLIPLLLVAPRSKLLRTFAGVASSLALVGVPLLLATSGRALASIVVGTGDLGGSNFSFYGIALHSSSEVVALRLVAIALSALAAWWARDRLTTAVLEPAPFLALLALSLALRLSFEVSLFGYYLMSFSVLLLLVEVSVGRIRLLYVLWTAAATWATVDGGLVNRATFAGIDVGVWQFLLVVVALYLAARPLLTAARQASPTEPRSHNR